MKYLRKVSTKNCKDYSDMEIALAKLSPKSLKKYIKSSENMKKILPDEGFTMRMEAFINHAKNQLSYLENIRK